MSGKCFKFIPLFILIVPLVLVSGSQVLRQRYPPQPSQGWCYVPVRCNRQSPPHLQAPTPSPAVAGAPSQANRPSNSIRFQRNSTPRAQIPPLRTPMNATTSFPSVTTNLPLTTPTAISSYSPSRMTTPIPVSRTSLRTAAPTVSLSTVASTTSSRTLNSTTSAQPASLISGPLSSAVLE